MAYRSASVKTWPKSPARPSEQQEETLLPMPKSMRTTASLDFCLGFFHLTHLIALIEARLMPN